MGRGLRRHEGYCRWWKIGPLKSFIIYANGSLFNTSSHTFDLMLRMNSDQFPISVQASLQGTDEELFDGDKLKIDPQGEGIICFPNGVAGYALNTPRNSEFEAICDKGNVTARNNGNDWELHEHYPIDETGRRFELKQVPFPEFQPSSSTLALIEDLVHALDTGEPTRGGIQIARTNMELIFGFIESHRQRGAHVALPLKDRDLRLKGALALVCLFIGHDTSSPPALRPSARWVDAPAATYAARTKA